MREADDSDRAQRLVVVMPAAAGFLLFRYAGTRSSIVVGDGVAPNETWDWESMADRGWSGYLRARLHIV
jgi:hypothetical protein